MLSYVCDFEHTKAHANDLFVTLTNLQVLKDAVEGLRAELGQLSDRIDAAQAGLLAGEGVASQAQLQVRPAVACAV